MRSLPGNLVKLFSRDALAHMRRNFYGFDRSYHVARYHFVHKTPHAHTPLYLATHRRARPLTQAQEGTS